MTQRVHYKEELTDDELTLLHNGLDKSIVFTHGETLPSNPEFEILISGVPSESDITISPNMHTLIIPWAGLPKPVGEMMCGFPDITIYNIHHNAVTTAETAVTLLMTVAKQIVPLDSKLRHHDWSMRYQRTNSHKLTGKNLLLLGYGHIGQQIEKMLSGFEMKITKIRRSNPQPEQHIYTIESLHSLLPKAEIVITCLPLTDKTINLLGSKELALLPDKAILINISRGKIINEEALFNEMKTGRISAGIDVWYTYPKKPEDRKNTPVGAYPFDRLENLVMTPHIAEASTETDKMRINALIDLLNKLVDNPSGLQPVDPKEGY